LEIGQYLLVFQVLGPLGALSTIEKPIFFIAGAKFALQDIQTYLPGGFEDAPIISSGATLMLEAQITTDQSLDPYLIWYNGKNRIAEGHLSQGISRIFWKVPAQSGFHTLKAEAFPLKPRDAFGLKGKRIELSLPVSAKNDKKSAGAEALKRTLLSLLEPDNAEWAAAGTLRWYQCAGTLQDDTAPQKPGASLIPETNNPVAWMPWRNRYGLKIDSGAIYALPKTLFTLPPNAAGGRGQVLFHFALPQRNSPADSGAGVLFNARFYVNGSSEPLRLEAAYTTGELRLAYELAGESRRASAGLLGKSQDFITAVLSFTFTESRFYAKLRLQDGPLNQPSLQKDWTKTPEALPLPGALTGQGVFRIGGVPEAASGARGEPGKPACTIVLDDVITLFTPELAIPKAEPREPPVLEGQAPREPSPAPDRAVPGGLPKAEPKARSGAPPPLEGKNTGNSPSPKRLEAAPTVEVMPQPGADTKNALNKQEDQPKPSALPAALPAASRTQAETDRSSNPV
jgi:hypothetical protein